MTENRPIWKLSENLDKIKKNNSKYNFQWDLLEVDECFPVRLDEIKLATLRSMASAKGKSLNKKFKVYIKEDIYLVGRLL